MSNVAVIWLNVSTVTLEAFTVIGPPVPLYTSETAVA